MKLCRMCPEPAIQKAHAVYCREHSAYARARHHSGRPPLVGLSTRSCRRCGYEFMGRPSAVYCEPCRADAYREDAKLRMRRRADRTGRTLALHAYGEQAEAAARALGIQGKWCCKCGQVKPLDAFSTRRLKSGTVVPKGWCKTCISWAANHPKGEPIP